VLCYPLHEERPTHSMRRSVVEVDISNPESPIARLEVVIDGETSYRHTIEGSPIPRSSISMELGSLVPAFRDLLSKIGIKPGAWF